MTPTLLALDDDRERFAHLATLLAGRAEIVYAACPSCVAKALPRADAVLLDYDLDSGEPCPGCLASYGVWRGPMHRQQSKGLHHVPAIAARGVPVVVVSASSRENVGRLCIALAEAGVLFTRIAATENDPELKWIGWLWARGVL